LKASLAESLVVERGDYEYMIHPLTDGIPRVEPKILNDVVDAMIEVGNFDCDVILTVEALGIPLATALSLRTGKPFTIVRKRMYGLPGEVNLTQVTGYSKSALFLNGILPGETVTIVDDVVSTGGTMWALVEALKKMQVKIADILVVVEKTDKKAEIERKIGHQIKTIVKVEIIDGKVRVL
ncbi:MAG: hypoxanthine/guanine phosphoribosyltransferase, partial [Thermoplasmata archaeon]|nr:hypoxanthine/guanine phosphoribosyltransferase [Thermoplasmata archaeon]